MPILYWHLVYHRGDDCLLDQRVFGAQQAFHRFLLGRAQSPPVSQCSLLGRHRAVLAHIREQRSPYYQTISPSC